MKCIRRQIYLLIKLQSLVLSVHKACPLNSITIFNIGSSSLRKSNVQEKNFKENLINAQDRHHMRPSKAATPGLSYWSC